MMREACNVRVISNEGGSILLIQVRYRLDIELL